MNVNYRSDIDGLRAVAILSVLVFHAFPDALPGGFIGVDVFFVISGYLISFAIFNEIDAGKFSFSDFYARRTRRIFPALIAVLSSVFVVGFFVLLPVELTRLGKNIASAATFTLNFLLQRDVGYFDGAGSVNEVLNLWSLCIEEQFYLLFPPLFLLAYKLTLNRLAVIAAIIASSFALNIYLISSEATFTFFSPVTRFWELAVGGWLAYALPRNNWVRGPVSGFVLSGLGLSIILCGVFLITKDMAFPGWFALAPTIAACCLIAAEGPNALKGLLSNRLMVFVGKISYPLYLWHYPIFSYLRIYESGEPTVLVMSLAMAVSVLSAFLTYQFIEHPFRFGALKRVSHGMIIGSLVTALLCVGILGKLTQRERGFSQRMGGDWEQMLAQMDEPQGGQDCAFQDPIAESTCLISRPGVAPTVALIGDSHAVHFFAGAAKSVDLHGGNLIALTGPGCVPFIGVRTRQVKGDPEVCAAIVERVFLYLDNNPQIKTVLIATRGPISLTGKTFGQDEVPGRFIDSDVYPLAKTLPSLFAQGLDTTVSHLIKSGKKVVFILDNPELGFDPELCSDLSIARKKNPSCKVERSVVDARNLEYRGLVMQAKTKHPGLQVIDTLKTICDDQYCYARRDGRYIYRDNNHLTTFGSLLLAPEYQF
jgi:peptidoglycan/LPS O-acetylase OafA/YrhL